MTAFRTRLVVLQVEIDMPGRMEFQAADLAAHPHEREAVLHSPLERSGDLADAEFGQIGFGGGFTHESRMI